MQILKELDRERALLNGWLLQEALPLWWHIGADHADGGFFEKIDARSRPTDDPRRARVVARQIYCYASALRLGWEGPARHALDHGLAFFFARCLTGPGVLISLVSAGGEVLSDSFDLYDHAFALFGLAVATGVHPEPAPLAAAAAALRDALLRGWSNPHGGLHEAMPPIMPLRSNPHMHLLEACLAWLETDVADEHRGWGTLADHIVELCLARFIDPASGALREYFDLEWRPQAGDAGRIVEPGHQYEWGWLLLRWARLRGRPDVAAPALRLIDIAERHGVSPRSGLAINELWDDFSPKDRDSRLWPQTERLKALLMAAQHQETAAARDALLAKAVAAAKGLRGYLGAPLPGSWRETIAQDGGAVEEPARASSLYHLVGCIVALNDFASAEAAGAARDPRPGLARDGASPFGTSPARAQPVGHRHVG